MLTQTAKTRVPTHNNAANGRLPTSHPSSRKLPAWATTKNTELPARRIGQVRRMASLATLTSVRYGKLHSHSVFQKPSAASLLGSPAWSAYLWCRRWRFTHVAGAMYTPNALLTSDRAWTNHS